MCKYFLWFQFSILLKLSAVCQKQIQFIVQPELYKSYDSAFNQLKQLTEYSGDLLRGIFITEQVYQNSCLSFTDFEFTINKLSEIVKQNFSKQQLLKYNQPDSNNYKKNRAIYFTLFDTITLNYHGNSKDRIIPYSYSPEDPLGRQKWTNMFVTKLLATGKGNCHGLTYLYKIIADKIGAKCWLALAPNHIYIRNFSQYFGWYNTELTSRSFPTDAWIMTTSYVHPDAVRSGLYMDTLSNQQSIALCVLDLAKGYEDQTHNYYDGFILQCCDLVLQYHPVNPMALLLKAETLRKVYDLQNKEKKLEAVETYKKMEAAYVGLAKLYYREMPEKMYLQWLNTARSYNNKNIE